MIYTFYGRVSTDSNEQLSALDNQEQYWIDFFGKNGMKMNHDCGAYYSREGNIQPRSGYYIDEGISGYKSKKYRKAFLKMLNDAKQHKFEMIYTRSISRFGRNVEDISATINELKRYGIGVYFEDINANSLDKNDEFKINIFISLAQEDSRLKSSAVQKGKLISAANGVWSGSAPYGYDIYTGELEIDGVMRYVKGRLVINQSEAEIVRMVFHQYLYEGWGLSKIAKYLNKNEVPRKRKASKWDQSIIGKMLSNPIYKGVFWLHRTRTVDAQQNIIEKVPDDEQIIKHDPLLQIISDDNYDKVQDSKKERFKQFGDFKYEEIDGKKVRIGIDKKTGRYSGAHTFSNLLRCGNCGSPLRYKKQRSTSRVHHYWFCSNNDKMGQCKYRNLQRDEGILEWVKQEILAFSNNSQFHDDMLDKILKVKFDIKDIDKKIALMESNLNPLMRKREINFEAYSEGIIKKEEYSERASKLDKEIEATNTELNKLKNIDKEKQYIVQQYNQFVDTIRQIDTDNLTNQVLRKIIDKIVFKTLDPDLISAHEQGLIDHHIDREIFWLFNNESLDEISYEHTKRYFTVGEDENIDSQTLMPIK